MNVSSFVPSQFLAPRYWPTWLGLGLLRLAVYLPYAWQLQLGKCLGWIFYWGLPSKRRIARINLQLAFPNLSAAARQILLRRNFQNLGMGLFEMAMAWWQSPAWLQQRLHHIEGMHHLDAALAAGRGAILLTGHSTALEIGGHLLVLHTPMQAMYRKASNPLVNALALQARRRRFAQIVSRKELRDFLRGLRQNLASWYAPDQDFGRRRSVFASFMGVATATVPATAKLAKLSNAPVLPFFPVRLANNQGYVLHILPPLEQFPSDDEIADARQVNAAIELQIQAAPEQYMWVHRRFKTRPLGEAAVY